jgi:type IV pilus assembly protein PilV
MHAMKIFRHPYTTRNRSTGFSLVEVLVALLVLSIGLLGLAMLQVQGMKYNTNSYQRTQATLLAYDIIDRIRANKVGADAGAYCLNVTAPADPCETNAVVATTSCGTSTGGCTSYTDLAKYDISQWYTLQAKYLPNSGTGAAPSKIKRQSVTTAGGKSIFQYHVTINWMEHDTPISQTWVVEL